MDKRNEILQIPKSIMITGASSTGKSTLVRAIVDTTKVERIAGDTTRAMREGEKQGFDFNYLKSVEEFLDRYAKGHYMDPTLEVTHFNNNYYGSPREWIDKTIDKVKPVIFTPTSTVSAKLIKESCGDSLFWVHLYTDDSSRVERLLGRAITQEEITYRLYQGDSQGLNSNADLNVDTTKSTPNEVQIILFKSLLEEL